MPDFYGHILLTDPRPHAPTLVACVWLDKASGAANGTVVASAYDFQAAEAIRKLLDERLVKQVAAARPA